MKTVKNRNNKLNLKRTEMISEQVLYLFLYPWILFIATIPGAVLTFVFAGFAGQLLNYLPEKK